MSYQGEHIDPLKRKFCKKFKIKRLEHGRDLRKQKVKDKDGKPANENEKEAEKNENKNNPLNTAEGYKIVDIEFLVSQLKEGWKTCKKKISLCNIEEETYSISDVWVTDLETNYAGINFIHNPPRNTTWREQNPSPRDNTGSQKPHPRDIKLENFTNVSINSDTIWNVKLCGLNK